MRGRKKPVEVDLIQYTGSNGEKVIAWVIEHGGDEDFFNEHPPLEFDNDRHQLGTIYDYLHDTDVGVFKDNWIICGPKGEFYPVDNEVFHGTYDLIDDDIVLSDAVIKSLNDLKEMTKGIDDVLIERWGVKTPDEIRAGLEEYNGPDPDNV